jgi:FKBP-type peptidyl-prolyl cis-trans isomerase SlyD
MIMKVSRSMVVGIQYTLKNSQGELLDQATVDEPFEYIHGANHIVEGLEDELEDLELGATFNAIIPAELGYGEYRDHLVSEVSKSQFPEDFVVEVGQRFVMTGADGDQPFVIAELRDKIVIIDGNHDLAGEDLHYAGEVVSIRSATEDELYRGTLHGSCCSGGKCSAQD